MPKFSPPGDPVIREAATIMPKQSLTISIHDRFSRVWKALVKYRWLYFLMIPGLVYFVIFRYLPLWNAQIAFKDFKPLLG